MRKVLVTGSAGFIGYHLSKLLLDEGFAVHGYDAITDYYDVTLKQRRHAMLHQLQHFGATIGLLEDMATLTETMNSFQPDVIVHLAAQAWVRYSLEKSAGVSGHIHCRPVQCKALLQSSGHIENAKAAPTPSCPPS